MIEELKELLELKTKYYKYFDLEESLAAVQKDGWALQFVKEQTPEICLAAVKENSDALKYVKEKVIENYLAAVEKNGGLENVKEKEQDEIMHLSEIEKDILSVIRLREKYDISLKINKTGIKIYIQNDDCLEKK